MSHADLSGREFGFLHGSNLEVGTSPLIAVLPPADEALACQTPSGGRRGDATSRDAVSLPGVNGPDGIGNPGTGGSRGKIEKETNADGGVPRNDKPPTELEMETIKTLELDRLMAEANVGYEGVQSLRGAGLTCVGDLREVSKAQLREMFGLGFFEAERLGRLVRLHFESAYVPQRGGNPESASKPRPTTPQMPPRAQHLAASEPSEAETRCAERDLLAAEAAAARAQAEEDEARRVEELARRTATLQLTPRAQLRAATQQREEETLRAEREMLDADAAAARFMHIIFRVY